MRLIQIGLGIPDPRDRASICAGRDERLMKEMPCPVYGGSELPGAGVAADPARRIFQRAIL